MGVWRAGALPFWCSRPPCARNTRFACLCGVPVCAFALNAVLACCRGWQALMCVSAIHLWCLDWMRDRFPRFWCANVELTCLCPERVCFVEASTAHACAPSPSFTSHQGTRLPIHCGKFGRRATSFWCGFWCCRMKCVLRVERSSFEAQISAGRWRELLPLIVPSVHVYVLGFCEVWLPCEQWSSFVFGVCERHVLSIDCVLTFEQCVSAHDVWCGRTLQCSHWPSQANWKVSLCSAVLKDLL